MSFRRCSGDLSSAGHNVTPAMPVRPCAWLMSGRRGGSDLSGVLHDVTRATPVRPRACLMTGRCSGSNPCRVVQGVVNYLPPAAARARLGQQRLPSFRAMKRPEALPSEWHSERLGAR